MKSTEILNKIKTFLGEEIQEETQLTEEVLELAQLKLENGTVLEADSFEAGKEVFILTEDEKVAVPKGEYQMEDGRMLVVEEEGLIAEIKAAEEKEPTVEEEDRTDAEEEKEEMQYVRKEEFENAVEEIKGMIKELKEEKKEKEEMAEQVKEELSKTPAVEPISHNPEAKQEFKVKFGQNRKETALDRVMKKLTN
jgi:glucose/arabinose dehydrogenase|tara:strand:+ start:168 stop:752 length:585 start_codon:yes stop_codon:yes gene_type:complete